MSFLKKLGEVFGQPQEKAKQEVKRAPVARKKKKSSMILEKSFLQRKFSKPAVTTTTYTDSEWIYAAINAISSSVAKVPIRLYRGERNGTKTEVIDHQILRVLKKPNPHQTFNDLRVFTQMNLELFGVAYWYLARGEITGQPKEIYPLNSSEVTTRTNAAGDLIGYSVSRWGYHATIPLDEIIAFRQVSPSSIYEGESAAKACARSVKADENTLKYVESFFENSARPDFILSVMGISEENSSKLEQRWRNKHGGVAKSNKPAIIDGEIKLEKLTASIKDLDITEQSRERRDRILAAYGVPKAVLGMVDDVNRASMEGSKLAFSEFVVDTRLQEFVEKLTAFLLPKYASSENLFFVADEHIPRDSELMIREIESGINSGYMTINEARDVRGLDPVKNGDVLLVSFGKVPIDQIVAVPPPPPKQIESSKKKASSDYEDEYLALHGRNEKKFAGMLDDLFERQRRDVLGNIKKAISKDALNPIDESKWVREFIDSSVPLYAVSITDGGELGAGVVASLARRATEFNPRMSSIVNATSQMSMKFAQFVNETTKDKLRKSLMEGVAAGESEAKMADRVDEVFVTRKNNAMTIARTETTGSINFGQIESYRQNGVNKKKWSAALDGDTRPAHAEANGQVRGIDDPFSVGGELLQMPGDPAASAGNKINCRCRMLPII